MNGFGHAKFLSLRFTQNSPLWVNEISKNFKDFSQ